MIKLIAAVSKNGVIGNNGDLIYRDKQDLQNFKDLTVSHNVYMGRKTWNSIGNKNLPNRNNYVFTRNIIHQKEFTNPYIDIETFLDVYYQNKIDGIESRKIDYIIGGEEIYRQLLPHADELVLSVFREEAKGDTYFPTIDLDIWECKYKKVFKNFDLKTYIRKDVSNR